MRAPRRFLCALLLAGPHFLRAALAAPTPILPIAEVRPGQRAVVHTVLSGSAVDTFSAEIVGVLRGGGAEGNIILARATNPQVAHTGIAQGMSGSPVYVDGRLAGALSSGWSFVKDPLFGITPIEEMLPVLDLPERGARGGSAGPGGVEPPAGGRSGAAWGVFRWPGDEPAAAPPRREPVAGVAALAVPLACVGMPAAALDLVREDLAALGLRAVPAGVSDPRATAEVLVPGSAFAVDLVRGDLRLAAIGTITWREGDRFLAFGHPFFQAGDVRLPVSTAEIVTIVPSQIIAFKLGMPGRTVGTLLQDRRTAVSGRIGPVPELTPVRVTVTGARPSIQRFRYEVVEDRLLGPQLVAIAAVSSLFESGGGSGFQTVRWRLRLHAAGRRPLELEDAAAGDGFAGELLGQVRTPLDFLLNNPFERLGLDSVAIELGVEPGRSSWTLRNARVERAAAAPGEEVAVRCEVERYRGGTELRELRLRVPAELGEGDAVLWVGGGPELTRYEAQRNPGRFRPTTMDDAWRRLASMRRGDGLHAALLVRAPDVTADGADLPELPASAQAVLLTPQSRGDDARPGRLTLLAETVVKLPGVVRGELLLPLAVERGAARRTP